MDLDLLSTFPKEYARSNGGIGRGARFPRSAMEERKGKHELNSLGKKRGPFIGSLKN